MCIGVKGNIVTPMRVRTADNQIIDLWQLVTEAFKSGMVCYACDH
jgi:hypothetical protein